LPSQSVNRNVSSIGSVLQPARDVVDGPTSRGSRRRLARGARTRVDGQLRAQQGRIKARPVNEPHRNGQWSCGRLGSPFSKQRPLTIPMQSIGGHHLQFDACPTHLRITVQRACNGAQGEIARLLPSGRWQLMTLRLAFGKSLTTACVRRREGQRQDRACAACDRGASETGRPRASDAARRGRRAPASRPNTLACCG
jgi:hypothetical protein